MTEEERREKRRKYMAEYYAKNREKAIARAAQWAADNPDKAKKNHAKWLAENPERRAEHVAKYHEGHKEKVRAYRKANRERITKMNLKRIQDQKARAIEYLGGRCERCGADHFPPCVYEFHHKNPDEKEHNLATLIASVGWDEVVKELVKCMLLCSNCHRIIHHELRWGAAE